MSDAASAAYVPDIHTFVREMSAGNGESARALRLLYAGLATLDADIEPAAQHEALVRVGRWVCAGPRPGRPAGDPPDPRTTRLAMLISALDKVPAWRRQLSLLVQRAIERSSAVRLFCEVGLPNDQGFWTETADRIARRLLPSVADEGELAELTSQLFRSEADAAWLATVPLELLASFDALLDSPWTPLVAMAEDASRIVATRASALGLSEAIRRRSPDAPVRDSPFFHLASAPLESLPALANGCRGHLAMVRHNLESRGVSVNVVYRIDVISRSLDRIDALVPLASDAPREAKLEAARGLLSSLVLAQVRDREIAEVVRSNVRLLAQKVIERAGTSGEHYITSTRREYYAMLASAAGGGVLTTLTCVVKYLMKWMHLAPFLEGFFASINYAASFVLLQLLGLTLATKQPSMTAATLAASLGAPGAKYKLDDLHAMILRICRSQFAAALGNIAAVVPTAILFDMWHSRAYGESFLDRAEADKAIASFHPFETGTILYAALTGVLLWCGSLGAGWLENWATYRRLPEAIEQHRLRRVLGVRTMARIASFIRRNVGGFGGNVTLGFLLGMTPVLGAFFGLPLDVRHVTLSSGTLALAAWSVGPFATLSVSFAWAVLGIAVIGLCNFGVSFALALTVAMRARDVGIQVQGLLMRRVLRSVVRAPLALILPPPKAAAPAPSSGDALP